MAEAAWLIASAALARTESRGAHYRLDFPAEDPEQAARAFWRLTSKGLISVDPFVGEDADVESQRHAEKKRNAERVAA